MRANPDSAPTVAKPMPNLEPRKNRRPETDASRPTMTDRSEARLPEPKTTDYDDFSWM
jgi:hypothetical protein